MSTMQQVREAELRWKEADAALRAYTERPIPNRRTSNAIYTLRTHYRWPWANTFGSCHNSAFDSTFTFRRSVATHAARKRSSRLSEQHCA